MRKAGVRSPACVSTSTSQVAATNSILARFRPRSWSLQANEGWTRSMLGTLMGGASGG